MAERAPCPGSGSPDFYLHDGELRCEQVAIRDLVAQYGSPLYVYSAATIRERAAFHKVMDAETKPINDADLLGWWACRTIKVGGKFSGLVVYSWFDCKVSVRDGFLFFEKRSGSQRLSGRLYQDGSDRRVLLAAPTYNDEPQRAYSGPEGGITDPQRQDKLGVLSQIVDGRLRVVFPWSVLESTYDVLELKRPN